MKKIFLGFLFFLAITLNAQTILLQKSYWDDNHPNGDVMQQFQTSEDWFYDIQPRLSEGKYIASGYVVYPTWDNVDECIGNTRTCINQAASCAFFELNQALLPFESAYNKHLKGTASMAAISLIDENGTKSFIKTFCDGELFKLINTSDGGVLAIGYTASVKGFRDGGNSFFKYNPDEVSFGNFHDDVECVDRKGIRHALVIKLNSTYELQWINIYGIENYSSNAKTAYEAEAHAYDVVEKANGNFVVVGLAEDRNDLTTNEYGQIPELVIPKPFAFEITSDGNLVWKKLFNPESGTTKRTGVFYSVTAIGNDIYVGGVEANTEILMYSSSKISTLKVVLRKLNQSPNPTELWYKYFGVDGSKNEVNSDLAVNAAGELLCPVGVKCSGSKAFSAHGLCEEARVYRIDALTGAEIGMTSFGSIKAYDLKIGVVPISNDGGFAVVSTKKTFSDNTPFENKNCAFDNSIYAGEGFLKFSNSDAYVAKCNAAGEIEWATTFDSHSQSPDGDPSTWTVPDPFMRDIKRQECVYSIIADHNGDLLIAGNTSENFDDMYITKLEHSCDLQLNKHRFKKNHTEWDESTNIEHVNKYYSSFITAGANQFIVENDGEAELIAKTRVTLKNGFRANTGSYFKAGINSAITCSTGPLYSLSEGSIPLAIPEETNMSRNILIYPNPATNKINVVMNDEKIESYKVYSADGKMILFGAVQSNSFMVNTSLLNGFYIITLQLVNGEVIYRSFVVSN